MAKRKQQRNAAIAEVESPIINSPFEEPLWHWKIEPGEQPIKASGRRRANYYYRVPESSGTGRRVRDQGELIESRVGESVELEIVNAIRERVKEWRAGERTGGGSYDGVSPVTRELLDLWRDDEEGRKQRLFFAQIEAAETIIFLTEASDIYRKGLPGIPKDEPGAEAKSKGVKFFDRYACKMATGSGKTTVMGMLAAWSILNRVSTPGDNRFTDTILIVCPNVTIRERLKELDPALGDLSLYRTRQLVPPHRMEELRRGEIMIANWHRLAKKESSTVNGDSAKVVKTGERAVIVRNQGKRNESVETKYFESDKAWFRRIRRELGTGKGRCPHWLVFNDEAHHAYRRGDAEAEASPDDDKELAKKNAHEATIWIEGIDRINRLAGGRGKGVKLCVDLSATPFYIQGSGNEVGKPFPWIVSDFGLLDAIESGLVKIPQLPTRDATGADEAAYFNIWRWVQAKAEEDGRGDSMTPETVLSYASAPINLLAQDWRERYDEWEKHSKERARHPIPPVLIVVCRDTKLAKEVHGWLADGNDSYGDAPEWFRNGPGREVTVRIDSKAAEDIEKGGTNDEYKRLRYILDSVGKAEWPGGKVPEDWSALVAKHNEKVASDSNDGSLHWLDEKIPPGRDVRCIVSVAMLSEGWDANTVTHIVGLRPFGSQLLCEQVVGRALRRLNYALIDGSEDNPAMFAEETAKVFGVPFELVPFKVSPAGPQPPRPDPHHIFSVPEKVEYEIEFPIVSGYHEVGEFEVSIDWDKVSILTIDPKDIPQRVMLTALTATEGALSSYGPGEKPDLSLTEWRKNFRDQQVAFRIAGEVCRLWMNDHGVEAVPAHRLFPELASAAKKFLAEKLDFKSEDCRPCDVLLVGRYMQAACESLLVAIGKGARAGQSEVAVIPQGASGRGSTLHVDFHTTKPVSEARRCHLNLMVADTEKWEQSAAFALDTHPGVRKWVKNDRLGFSIPYRHGGRTAKYLPDFLVVTDADENVIVEIKGQITDKSDAKAKAAERWAEAVNRLGDRGRWSYLLVTDPANLGPMLDDACVSKWNGSA